MLNIAFTLQYTVIRFYAMNDKDLFRAFIKLFIIYKILTNILRNIILVYKIISIFPE